jgi:geranylgeranyl reductase family protein
MYDVIVVGAGPAGSTAAHRCALLGHNTLLIEKATLPRYKVCGGGIPSPVLSHLGFPLDPDLVQGELFGIRVRYGNYFVDVRRPYRLGICTTRGKFDAFLTSKAVEVGTELHDAEMVTSVEKQGSHMHVRCKNRSYIARIVIGADGANSVVAKGVRPAFDRKQIGIGCDVTLPAEAISLDDPQIGIFDFGAVRYGYGWIFPKQHWISTGIGAQASKLRNPKAALDHFLRRLGVSSEGIKPRWHVLPAGGYRRKTVAERVILVGDAAGYVDPLFGGGIEMAVLSGIFAAEAANAAIASDNFTENTLNLYQRRCDSAFGGRLRLSLFASLILHRHPNLLIKPFAMDASLTQWLIDASLGYNKDAGVNRRLAARLPLLLFKAAISPS